MPSAARPFTRRVLDDLHAHDIRLATVVVHAGVSSLEVETDEPELIREGYAEAVREGDLWHEFGESHRLPVRS